MGNLKRALPRWRRDDFLRLIGVSDLEPSSGPLEHLRDAAAAASCQPRLAGNAREVMAALAAAVEVAEGLLPRARLATLLGVGRRTVYRLKDREADPALVRAIRLQLALRRAKGARLIP